MRSRPCRESRLRYDAERAEVELVSDASKGPYPGVHRFSALEFLARRVDHIPAKGEVRVRYCGAYASRRRGWRRRRGVVLAGTGHEDAHDIEHATSTLLTSSTFAHARPDAHRYHHGRTKRVQGMTSPEGFILSSVPLASRAERTR